MKFLIPTLMLTVLTGCASVINKAHQDVRIETQSSDGQMITNAECTLRNSRETQTVQSGGTAKVRRSGDDLHIRCTHPSYPEANGRAVSRKNKEMLSNAFFMFGSGAIVDHKLGYGYTYPTWIRLVFGDRLLFDRSEESKNQPVPAQPDNNMTH